MANRLKESLKRGKAAAKFAFKQTAHELQENEGIIILPTDPPKFKLKKKKKKRINI